MSDSKKIGYPVHLDVLHNFPVNQNKRKELPPAGARVYRAS